MANNKKTTGTAGVTTGVTTGVATINVAILMSKIYDKETTAKSQASRVFKGARENEYQVETATVKAALKEMAARKGESKGKTAAEKLLKTFDKDVAAGVYTGETPVVERDSTTQFTWGKYYQELKNSIEAKDMDALVTIADKINAEVEAKKEAKGE